MWVGTEACSYEKILKNGDIEYSSIHGQCPYNKYKAQALYQLIVIYFIIFYFLSPTEKTSIKLTTNSNLFRSKKQINNMLQ